MALILAIDTSCDDTSAAVVEGRHLRSNIIHSQTPLHEPYGGVFPTVAKQAHREHFSSVVAEAMAAAQVEWSNLTAIAVTQGPGLAPTLEVGIIGATQLAKHHHLPLLPINHLEGHLWSVWADVDTHPQFPALGLVISGGHTFFVKVNGLSEYEVLGETIDDAAGEALDKVGRLLGLGYPAGAKIEQLAHPANSQAYPFPLPMTTSGNYNLSFAGLKTSAKNLYTKLTADHPLSSNEVADFAASFQQAVFRAVIYKLEKILSNEFTEQTVSLWLGGGVAANQMLRHQLQTVSGISQVLVPANLDLCRDNAGMIGLVAHLYLEHQPQLLNQPLPQLDRKPKWPLA